MNKNMLDLKIAVEKLSSKLNVEVYELCIEEGTAVYVDFGKRNCGTALEVYKYLLYSGVDIRVNMIAVISRCRECDKSPDDVEFWDDLAIIVSLYEALEIEGHYVDKKALILTAH